MNYRICLPIRLLGIVAVVLLMHSTITAQQAGAGRKTARAEAAPENWAPPRTLWGDPDLQGVYTFSTHTPLERPGGLAGRDVYSEDEIDEIERREAAAREADVVNAPPGALGPSYNAFWTANEKGTLTGRTSLIIDPENGRLPPLTAEAEKRRQEHLAKEKANRIEIPPVVHTLYNTWEDHPPYTRCLARPIPRIYQSYNHGTQILQTPGYVTIHYESMHDVRIIPLDGRPHLDPSIRQWNGDSRGRWEGDTLVVESTNFNPKQGFPHHGGGGWSTQGNIRITERFKKIDPKNISYEVTVEDPTTWTQPWTFSLPWRGDDPNYQVPEDLFEYACHEGNYRMMENSLLGTRALKKGQSPK